MENPIYIKIPVLILWEERCIDASVMENSLLLKLLMSSLCADADSLSWAVELTRTSLTRPKSALRMIFLVLLFAQKKSCNKICKHFL